MKEFSTTLDINATPETIWQILTDSSKYTEWDPGMLKLEGDIAPGQKLTIYTKAAPERAFTPTVSEFEPAKRMVWASGMPLGLFSGTRTFTLEPVADGRVRFHMHERFEGLMMPLIGGTIPDLTPVFDAFAQALRDRAEAV